MKFTESTIPGAYRVDPEPIEDERGHFARMWCRDELRERGLVGELAQASVSYNNRRGTIRGMHMQAPPSAEAKLIACTKGSIYDVIVDLRPDEPTFLRWEAFTITAGNRRMVYVPEGVAHGFQTLEPNTEVQYHISAPYDPERSLGFRHDDAAFDIAWPYEVTSISERDQNHPNFSLERLEKQLEYTA